MTETQRRASASRAPRVTLSRSTAYISHPSGSFGFLSLSTVLHSRNSGHLGSVGAAGSGPACWLVTAGDRKAVLVSHAFDSSGSPSLRGRDLFIKMLSIRLRGGIGMQSTEFKTPQP